MRKKIEEQLAQLAFGDLDAEEAKLLELRTQGDPEASRTLQDYSRMKEELRSLSVDVPADQLSKERLREAILTRGLEHKAAPARPTWLWMPAAAAALAFGAMFIKGQLASANHPGPMVVDSTKAKAEFNIPKIIKPSRSDSSVAKNLPPKVISDEPATVVAVNEDHRGRWRRNNEEVLANRGDRDNFSTSREMPMLTTFEGGMESAQTDAALKSGVDFGEEKVESVGRSAPAGSPTGTAPAIVVIQPETDSNTGTLKATEIENTTNVVVGG